MKQLQPIVTAEFDIAGEQPMVLSIFKPVLDDSGTTWGCAFEFSAPFEFTRTIFGASSLQSLVLALKVISSYLYSSTLYKEGKIGVSGEFGGDLSIPATHHCFDIAPYPF